MFSCFQSLLSETIMKNVTSLKNEHRHILRFLFVAWLEHFTVRWIGRRGQQNAFPDCPILLHRVYFCRIVLKMKSTDESKKISELEKQIPENLTSLLLTPQGKALSLSLPCGGSAFNTLNAELNPICHLLALLGAHHILHVSRVRVKVLKPMLKSDIEC